MKRPPMTLTTNRSDAFRSVIRTDALAKGREFKRLEPDDDCTASVEEHGSRFYVRIKSPSFAGWIAQ